MGKRSTWIREGDFPWSLALLGGAILSALTMGYSHAYCADGPARGFPLPIVRPAHDAQAAISTIFLGSIEQVHSEFWLTGFAVNLLAWWMTTAAVLFLYRYWRG